jgi:hypothetical protein
VADVGHCRVNLLTFGTDAVQQLTACWQQAAGATYHPWADVVTIIGCLDDLRDDWGSERLLRPRRWHSARLSLCGTTTNR